MKVRVSILIGQMFSVSLLLFAAGCASQSQPASATPQPQAASTPEVASGTCQLDYKKICQAYIDRPEVFYNGNKIETNRLLEEMGKHPQIVFSPTDDSGVTLAAIECHYSADPSGRNKLVSANLKSGSLLDEQAARYAKSKGLCGPDADYKKEISDQENRLLAK